MGTGWCGMTGLVEAPLAKLHPVHACFAAQSPPTLHDPMDCRPPAPLSMGFSRQEYWSGLPFPPPGDLPDPGTEPKSPVSPALQADSLLTEPSGKPTPHPRMNPS